MANCKINYAVAPNGEPSKLFGQLVRLTGGNQEKAFKMYLDAMDTQFPSEDLNDQGEATLEALEEANFFDSFDLVRFQKGPSSFNKIAIENDVAEHVVDQLRGAKDFLQKQLNDGLTEQEKDNIRTRIREIENDIGRIANREGKAGAFREVGKRQMNWVDTLDDESHSRQLLLAYRMLDKMWDTDNTYQFLPEDQRADPKGEFKEMKDAFTDLAKEADKRIDRIVDITLSTIQDQVEDEIGRPVETEELTRLQDVGTLRQNLYNLSHVDEKITQFIREVTINASRKEDSTIQDLQVDLQQFEEDIDDPSVILREDENGNKLPEVISPYSKTYYEKRSDLLSTYYNKLDDVSELEQDESRKARKRLAKDLYDDLNELEILINPNRLSDQQTKNLTKEERAYKQELINKGIDEERVDYALEEAKRTLAKYKERERSHQDFLDSQIEDGLNENDKLRDDDGNLETDEQWKQRKLRNWRKNNSPYLYYQDRIENDSVEFPFNTGYEHTNSLPRPTEENYSDAWNDLTEREKEFWHYYTQTINTVAGWLPKDTTRGLDETFLPKIEKNALEQFQFNGAFYTGKNMVRQFMNSIRNMEANTDALLSEAEDDIDTTAFGSPADRDRVPVKFINHPYHSKKKSLKRKLEKGEIDKEEYQKRLNKDLSLDPIKALQMFTAMGLNYKNMTDVSAVSELAYAMLERANTVNEEGDLVSRGGPVRLREQVRDEINHLIYGVTRKQNEGESSYFDNVTLNPFNSFSNRRRMREIENKRDEIEEQFQNNEIDEQEYDKKLNELENEYRDLAGKPLVWSKVVDNSLLPFMQLKGMGFNLFAGVRNIAHALIGGMIHAAGGQEFTDKDFINAMGIFMKDQTSRRKKVDALMSNFSILFETAEVKYGEDRKFDGLDPYIIQNRTEFVGQGMTMIATMLNETVEDKEGNERPLWQAFDENADWKTDEFGENESWQPGNQLKGQDQGSDFVRFRNKIIQLNNSIHGDYAKDSTQRIKKYTLGRLVSMFRTWIPELVAYRWQKTRYDQHLGREVTGSYRSTLRSLRDNGVGETLKTMTGAIPYVNNPETALDENQAANVRKVAREMQMMAALATVMLALKASIDEDEEKSVGMKIAMNNLIMVQQDISLWMNPSAMIQLAENPVPATSVWVDYENAMYKTYEYLSDEDYKGDNPVWGWTKATPVIGQLNTIKWQTERVLNE